MQSKATLGMGSNRPSMVETLGQVGSLNFTRAVEGELGFTEGYLIFRAVLVGLEASL